MSRDSETVSKNMRSIHSKDTSIELQLRKALWHKGYRYRKNYKALPGSPDIVLTKYKIAIFCDSEFFHGKDWEILKLRLEKGKNPDYWIKKIERNRSRDFETDKKLLFLGYTVIHFWGQDIKKHTDECIQAIEEDLYGLHIDEIDGELCLRLDKAKGTTYLSMFDMFHAWQEQAEKLKSGEITQEEYDQWRYNYPKNAK